MLWFLVDGITHLILEGSYLYYAWIGGAVNHSGVFPWIWNEYSKADKRWNVRYLLSFAVTFSERSERVSSPQ
jgi:hypothetical protein